MKPVSVKSWWLLLKEPDECISKYKQAVFVPNTCPTCVGYHWLHSWYDFAAMLSGPASHNLTAELSWSETSANHDKDLLVKFAIKPLSCPASQWKKKKALVNVLLFVTTMWSFTAAVNSHDLLIKPSWYRIPSAGESRTCEFLKWLCSLFGACYSSGLSLIFMTSQWHLACINYSTCLQGLLLQNLYCKHWTLPVNTERYSDYNSVPDSW